MDKEKEEVLARIAKNIISRGRNLSLNDSRYLEGTIKGYILAKTEDIAEKNEKRSA